MREEDQQRVRKYIRMHLHSSRVEGVEKQHAGRDRREPRVFRSRQISLSRPSMMVPPMRACGCVRIRRVGCTFRLLSTIAIDDSIDIVDGYLGYRR